MGTYISLRHHTFKYVYCISILHCLVILHLKVTEAVTSGVLQKKLFLKILWYSQEKACVFDKVAGLHNFLETYYKIKKKTCKWFFLKLWAQKHANTQQKTVCALVERNCVLFYLIVVLREGNHNWFELLNKVF